MVEIYRTEHYEGPVDGNFTDATAAILAGINTESSTDESDTDTEEEETVPTWCDYHYCTILIIVSTYFSKNNLSC